MVKVGEPKGVTVGVMEGEELDGAVVGSVVFVVEGLNVGVTVDGDRVGRFDGDFVDGDIVSPGIKGVKLGPMLGGRDGGLGW